MAQRAGEKCRVAVGSTNPTKVNAVRKAMLLLCTPEVVSVTVASGVPSQPHGLRELLLGSINRACNALRRMAADYGVGVEAGFIRLPAGMAVELQVAAIVDSKGGLSIGFSQGFMLPRHWLEELEKRVELGAIAEKATGRRGIGEKLGLIGYLTLGHVTRTELTYEAVVMALVPRLNMHLYQQLPKCNQVLQLLRESL